MFRVGLNPSSPELCPGFAPMSGRVLVSVADVRLPRHPAPLLRPVLFGFPSFRPPPHPPRHPTPSPFPSSPLPPRYRRPHLRLPLSQGLSEHFYPPTRLLCIFSPVLSCYSPPRAPHATPVAPETRDPSPVLRPPDSRPSPFLTQDSESFPLHGGWCGGRGCPRAPRSESGRAGGPGASAPFATRTPAVSTVHGAGFYLGLGWTGPALCGGRRQPGRAPRSRPMSLPGRPVDRGPAALPAARLWSEWTRAR